MSSYRRDGKGIHRDEARLAAAGLVPEWKRSYRKHDVFPECLHWRFHGHSGPLCRFCEVVRDYPEQR